MAEEQMCEGFVGLDLIARYGCRVRPIGSSHSIAGSKKGRNPARQFKCMMARAR